MPETQEEYTERLKDMLKHPKAEWFTPRPGMVAMANERGAGLVSASAMQADKKPVTQTVGFDVPNLRKRSDQERAQHLAKRLFDGVKARQPEAVDAALREYQIDKWTSGEPLSFEQCQAWAARLLRTALAKSQEH